jgi:predicted AlkP superfamily phosphohydrolase/phosphomutase
MSAKVLAVWLDGAEPTLVEEMMRAGKLPVLAGLRARGAYGRLACAPGDSQESTYGTVATGQPPAQTGSWLDGTFDPLTYTFPLDTERRNGDVPAYFALGPGYRVATFDVPRLALQKNTYGLQVLSWGAHAGGVPAASEPPAVYGELLARHGRHPTGDGIDHAPFNDEAALADLHSRLLQGVAVRGEATADLLGRDDWDLFLTALGEPHVAGHHFWPWPERPDLFASLGGPEAVRSIYLAVDRCLGRMVEAAGPNARTVVFSVRGMRANCEDAGTMVVLPELLFRDSFGRPGLDLGNPSLPPSPESLAGIHNWVMEIWNLRRRPDRLETALDRLPGPLARAARALLPTTPRLAHPLTCPPATGWQATTWYQPHWPRMRAFVLYSNSDGFIRLNVRGREAHGRIAPADYDRACGDVTDLVSALTDPTGRSVVEEIFRTRKTPRCGPNDHPADLVVRWAAHARDCFTHPRWGVLGPVPVHRAGAHTGDGFLCAAGPGIPSAIALRPGTPLDVAPTVLELMGAASSLPGRTLVRSARLLAA